MDSDAARRAEQLLLEPALRDGKINETDFNLDLRRIMGVRHFCRQKQSELLVVRDRVLAYMTQ